MENNLRMAPVNIVVRYSSLVNESRDIPSGHYEDESMKSTVVPNRNMILLSVAAAWSVASKFDGVAYCPATITFPYQRQLFLPINDNYILCKVALILYTGVDRTEDRALQGCTPSADTGAKTRKGRLSRPFGSFDVLGLSILGLAGSAKSRRSGGRASSSISQPPFDRALGDHSAASDFFFLACSSR